MYHLFACFLQNYEGVHKFTAPSFLFFILIYGITISFQGKH